MNEIMKRIKDLNSTLPGLLLTLGAAIALMKDTVNQVIKFIADLGYTWNPNPTTIALVLILCIGIKMIFFDGKKE